jgi:2-polyprenyl-3-methyl-5-hydroxy-6-metoxy-1,4-benzoquinol methylase
MEAIRQIDKDCSEPAIRLISSTSPPRRAELLQRIARKTPDAASMTNPPCPITGEPAIRHVQWVTTRLLSDLWRYTFSVDARPSFGNVERLGLWESPTGLHFFEPRPEGDHGFYSTFYDRVDAHARFTPKRQKNWRHEFDMAAAYVKPGDKVLDVGCGYASFRGAIPEAQYMGLDPNFADEDPLKTVRNQTIEDHLAEAAGTYDVVCSFQVLEHLTDPRSFFTAMVAAAKPGGLIIVGVPHVPSAITRIPNFLLNAPPHHLTWWTEPALAELARRAGAEPVSISHVPWGPHDAIVYWLERCSLIKSGKEYFKGDWWWHGSTVLSWLFGWLASKIMPVPKTKDEGSGLLMVAKRI